MKYTSSANESAKEYTPTATAKILRCTLYSADGTINALDTQSVVVLTDVDNLEIGGRNLLLDTRDFGSKSVWVGNRPNPVKDTDGMSYVGVVNTWSKYLKQRIDLLEDIYTLSFYAKASSETTLEVRNDNAPIKIFHTVNVNSVDWKRYLVSVEVDYEHNTELIFFTRAAETIYIKGIKLEKGNKATDWTPAPEDIETLVVTLSNDSQTVATDTNGNGGNFIDCSTKVQVYNGAQDVSKVATYTVTKSSGIAGTWDLSTRTYKVSALSTDNGWVDIKVTYNGNSITRRFTVSKSKQGAQGATGPQGDNGPQGPAGSSGRGIKTITEYYLISSAKTGITTASSGWSTSVPTMTATNKYLWNYEKFTFTDNTTATTTPKIIGIYGDKGATGATGTQGATGNGIKSITNYYLATASGSGVSASTSGWTTTVQAITASKKISVEL